jgi:hypothetical protein
MKDEWIGTFGLPVGRKELSGSPRADYKPKEWGDANEQGVQ